MVTRVDAPALPDDSVPIEYDWGNCSTNEWYGAQCYAHSGDGLSGCDDGESPRPPARRSVRLAGRPAFLGSLSFFHTDRPIVEVRLRDVLSGHTGPHAGDLYVSFTLPSGLWGALGFGAGRQLMAAGSVVFAAALACRAAFGGA